MSSSATHKRKKGEREGRIKRRRCQENVSRAHERCKDRVGREWGGGRALRVAFVRECEKNVKG